MSAPSVADDKTSRMQRKPFALPDSFGRDFVSSLVVFLIALPLCMGIAIASGVPPALGLATGIVGGVLVGIISGSPLQVSGPAAGLAVIVFELVRDFGLSMLGPILLVAGLIQFLAGRFKLGQWFRAISPAVVYGMLAGIGILIMAGQFHVMVDDKPRANGLANIIAIPEAFVKGIFPADGTSHHLAAAIGVLTLATIIIWSWRRPAAFKVIPGTLVGVVVATVTSAVLHLPIKHVELPGDFLTAFSLPTSSTLLRLIEPTVLLSAIAIALVASAETLLSAAAVDRMHSGPRANYDKELAAQGVGNMLCGFIGALPMTGVIVRSSANVQAGAKTRLSAILHGVWILAFVLLFPSALRLIPTASLAAILVYTGFRLVEREHLRKLAAYGRMPVAIYGATVAGIVIFDLLTGVIIGLALSIVKLLAKATRLDIKVFHDDERRRCDIHLEGVATFVRLPQLAAALESINGETVVHLHIQNLYYIDHTCLDLLKVTAEQRAERGGALEVHWEELTHRFHMRELKRAELGRNL